MGNDSFLEQSRRAFVVAKKDLRIYYRRPPVLIFGLILPFFLFLSFFMGRNMSMTRLFTALMTMAIFFSAMSIGPAIVPFEARSRNLERLVSSPVAVWALLLGDIIASLLYGLLISMVPLALGLFLGVEVIHPLILGLGMILAALCFASFGILLSSYPPTDIPSTVMMISNMVKFPLVFVSGIFVSIGNMGYWGKIIASFSPLTYFTDLVNYCTQNDSYYSIHGDFIALIAFAILFLVLSVKIHSRTLPQRI